MPILNPYLSFKDNAREAMEFYRSVFGGDLQVMTFGMIPGMAQDDSENDLVMHAMLTTPDGFVLMGSDTPDRMQFSAPTGISVSVSGDDEAQMQRFWDALADGGNITAPLETPPWGGRFGMLQDRYGIDWMVSYNAPQE